MMLVSDSGYSPCRRPHCDPRRDDVKCSEVDDQPRDTPVHARV
jgi:hypothetical protein